VSDIGVDIDLLLKGGLGLPAAAVDRQHVVVLPPAELVDVAGVEDVGHVVDSEIVLRFRCKSEFAAVLRGDVAFLQELVHRLVWLVVAGLLLGEFGDQLVQRDAVIHQNRDALDGDRRGVARDLRIVGRHDRSELLVEAGLWLREPDGVVVAGDHHDLHVAGDGLEILREGLVLVEDVDDVEFLVLFGVDADALDHVAGDQQVFDVLGLLGVQPVGEPLPGVGHELLAADVDIRNEGGLDVPVGRVRPKGPGNVGEVNRVGEEDAGVVGQRPLHGDTLVEQEFVDQLRDGFVLHHERGKRPRRVFEFD